MHKVNPTVKTIMLLIISFTLSFNFLAIINIGVILVSIILLILSKASLKKASLLFASAFIVAISLFFTSIWFGGSTAEIQSKELILAVSSLSGVKQGLIISTRILAFAGVGILFTLTTKAEDLVVSYVHHLKLPIKYAYGILAAFHFSENIKREYLQVKLAFKVRGIKVNIFSFKPLFVMLVNSLHWSDSIAAAMESKGFDSDFNRTYYYIPPFSFYDILLIIITVLTIIAVYILN